MSILAKHGAVHGAKFDQLNDIASRPWGIPIAKVNLKHACLQCPVHPMTGPCVLSMDRHFDVDLRLPFGLQSCPTRPTPWQKGCSLSQTQGNCDGMTVPVFTTEYSKPNLRSRICRVHPVTARIRTYPFYRQSELNVLTLSLYLFLFPALPFASIATNATGSRTPFLRHERIWGGSWAKQTIVTGAFGGLGARDRVGIGLVL